MGIVLFGVAIIAGLFIFSMSRGKKAVRAYVFLAARSEGASESSANKLASRIDTNSASKLNEAMLTFVKHCYGGRQLEMISAARLDGLRE